MNNSETAPSYYVDKLFDTIETLAFIVLHSTLLIIATDFVAFVLAGLSV